MAAKDKEENLTTLESKEPSFKCHWKSNILTEPDWNILKLVYPMAAIKKNTISQNTIKIIIWLLNEEFS